MSIDDVLDQAAPILALAPMQDITDLPFLKLVAECGGADVYFTEYFRVTPHYRPERSILRSVIGNPTGRPIIAQVIGNDVPAMVRTAQALEKFPVAGIDLNLGCPAPVVYRKCAGGGLLRYPDQVDKLLAALRSVVRGKLTVKTRIGFEDPTEFDGLLEIFSRHRIDLLSVHGRTVSQKYLPGVDWEAIAKASSRLACPVLANGDVSTPADATKVLRATGARGVMIGRGAVRNPWIFQQIRDHLSGRDISIPTGRDILRYVEELYAAECSPEVPERSQVQKMKRYMNFVGEGIEGGEGFLYEIRRCQAKRDFFAICARFFDHGEPVSLSPRKPSGRE